MKFKKFSLIFFSSIFIFVIYNFFVWTFFTEKLLITKDDKISGDLARMGYFSALSHDRYDEVNLSNKHIEREEYNGEEIDLLTIGDSFSNGGGKGLNSYYQDYLASKKDISILNLLNYQEKTRSYIETVYLLANSGFLEKTKVKYILIESVVRKSVQRFSREVNSDINDTYDNISKFYAFNTNKKERVSLPDVSFINNANFKFLSYNILYNFSDNAFISKVHRVKLNKDLFSIGKRDLLFYHDSILDFDNNNLDNLNLMNNNFNDLALFLKEKGIKLIFMPAVNKYDLYSDFIKNNKYKKDPFFEIYRSLEKEYIFIDTKDILYKQLLNNEKDIYYVDDTHWSYKASDIITDEISKFIN